MEETEYTSDKFDVNIVCKKCGSRNVAINSSLEAYCETSIEFECQECLSRY